MGNTGDAEGTPYHLHFEVHPVSLLYLGYDGAVDPTPYLDALEAPEGPAVPDRRRLGAGGPRRPAAPEPGAILLGMSDISTADGLDPASLERALTPLEGVSADADARADGRPRRRADLGRGSRPR